MSGVTTGKNTASLKKVRPRPINTELSSSAYSSASEMVLMTASSV